MKKPIVAILAVAMLLMGGCRRIADTRPVISVSVAPIGAMVEAIAGSDYRINVLVPEGAAAETCEPTPQQMVGLADSRLCFFTGTLGFESTMLSTLLSSQRTPATVRLSDTLTLLPRSLEGGYTDSADPHIWLSVINAKAMATVICTALCEADTAKADLYRANLMRYGQHLDSVDAQLREMLRPLTHRTLLVHHPALGYYCRDYGLRQTSIEQDGREPSVARVEQLVRTCRADSVQFVLAEQAYQGATADMLAREAGLRVVRYNPLAPQWEQTLLQLTQTLTQ